MTDTMLQQLTDAEYASWTTLPTATPDVLATYHGNVLWAESYDYEVYRAMYNNAEQEPVGDHGDYSGYDQNAYAAEQCNPGGGYEDDDWAEAVQHMQELLTDYLPEKLLQTKDAAMTAK